MAGKSIRFAVISDMHFSLNHDRFGSVLIDRSEQILVQTVSAINARADIDFVIINGDAVNVPTAYDTQRLRELVGLFKFPVYITAGNHDVPQPPGISSMEDLEPALTKQQFLRELDLCSVIPAGQTWWSAQPAAWLKLIALDSSYTGDWGGMVPEEQLVWLENELRAAQGIHTIVLIHHALTHPWEEFDLNNRYVVENAPGVMAVLEASDSVMAVISGHMHRSGYRKLNGISYFITPSLSAYPCGYGIFTVSPSALTYEMAQIPDETIIREARKIRYEKEMNVPPAMQEMWREMIEGMRKMEIAF